MNTDNLKSFAIKAGKTTLAVTAVNAMGVPQMIKQKLPDSTLALGASNGAVYALSNDAVNVVVDPKRSKLLNGAWLRLADDVGFYGVSSMVGNETRVLDNLYGMISNVSPLGQEMNINLTNGSYIAGVTMAADALDIGTGKNKVFDLIRRPVTTTMMLAK